MLDQLVESKSNSRENTRKSGFLLTTFIILATILLSGWVYSLFALDYGLGAGDLELSTLVAPVQIAEEAPPPPEPERPQEKQQVEKPQENVAMRTENIMRLDESPNEPPKTISTVQSTVPPRPKGAFVISDRNVDVSSASSGPTRDTGTGGGSTLAKAAPPDPIEREAAPPPPPPPPPAPPKPTPKPVPKTISGGVVNGKARNLVTPAYPPAAKAVRASGAVNVQVTIDEDGNVVSANAVSGHPLLRAAAERAARSSKFSPTQLSGQPVKVTGVIIYNFTQ